MEIIKIANEFRIKIAESVSDMKNKLQQAMSFSSSVIKTLDQYDTGYSELYKLSGMLYHLWKQSQSQDPEFKFKLESQLPDIKKLSLTCLNSVDVPGSKLNLQQVVKLVHSIVPVDLTVPSLPENNKENSNFVS